MPKYTNGNIMWSRFEIQGLIRSKGHLDFQNKKVLQENLLFHRIFSEFKGKKFS
jgi:hypothetical protein